MKNLPLLITTLLLFGFTLDLAAQFTFSGEYRPRSEYRHGFKALPGADQDAAFFTDQRTRLNFDYKTKGYKFFVSLQDVRVWGAQRQLVVNDGATTTLHEAYAQIFFTDKISLKAGRQEIIYDDHRIFGSVAWAQQARSHDAALLKFVNDGFKADLGLAFNQNGAGLVGTTYTVTGSYKAFQYLWLHKSWEKAKLSVLALNNGQQVRNSTGDFIEGVNYTQTLGTRLGYNAGKLSAFVNFYHQSGKMPNEAETKVNANLIGADLVFKATDNVKFVAGFESQSGNSQIEASDENNAFTPYYGTNHKFNGVMDYFYVGNHIGSVGLNDAYVKAQFKKNKFNGGVDVHYFMSAADVNDGAGKAMSSGLGTEVDVYFGTPIAEGVVLKAGYSQLFATETMEALKGGSKDETANWGYVMIIVKPTFLKK